MSGKSDPIRQTSPNFRTKFRGKPCETIEIATADCGGNVGIALATAICPSRGQGGSHALDEKICTLFVAADAGPRAGDAGVCDAAGSEAERLAGGGKRYRVPQIHEGN